jgi:hypothetical protein
MAASALLLLLLQQIVCEKFSFRQTDHFNEICPFQFQSLAAARVTGERCYDLKNTFPSKKLVNKSA